MDVWMYGCMYMDMCICVYVYMCICVYVYVCMCVCVYVCMCVCVYVYVCMYVCMHACMHACMYVCIIYIYILIYLFTYLFIYLCIYASIHVFISSFIYLCIYVFVYFFIYSYISYPKKTIFLVVFLVFHELEEGISFINSFAPECDALNALINIKPRSGNPWPLGRYKHRSTHCTLDIRLCAWHATLCVYWVTGFKMSKSMCMCVCIYIYMAPRLNPTMNHFLSQFLPQKKTLKMLTKHCKYQQKQRQGRL